MQWGRILIRFYKMNSLLTCYESFQEFLVQEQPIYPPNFFDIWCTDFISSTSYLFFSPLAWSVSYIFIYIMCAFWIDPSCFALIETIPNTDLYLDTSITTPFDRMNENNQSIHTYIEAENSWVMYRGFWVNKLGLELNIPHWLNISYICHIAPQALVNTVGGSYFKMNCLSVTIYPFFSEIDLGFIFDFSNSIFRIIFLEYNLSYNFISGTFNLLM